MIISFAGRITKVQINGTQVFPGTQKITLEVGKIITVTVTYEITAYGAGLLDYWTAGVTAKIGSQLGWDSTLHRGGDLKIATPAIGNLKVPPGGGTLIIRLYGIDATGPTAPPG